MTDKHKKCDVCDNSDEFYAGVASSALGPMSIAWCQICLAMTAEQKWMIDFIFEENNFRTKAGKEAFVYFDKNIDSYVNYGTKEIIPITLKNGGQEFKTRTEYVEWARENR